MAKLSRYSRPQQVLMNLLEQPGLVQAVQTLQPEVLTKLVQRIGLEDSGELVAMFTTEQLMEVFDEDLWKSAKPGDEEAFDDQRFALWLEVLLESGAALAARKVAEMDEDLLTLALSRQIFVIDIDEMASRMAGRQHTDDEEMLEKELDSCLYQEFEEYRVISRNHRTWEAIRAVLVELDSEHHELLSRLLDRCCHISHDYIEDNGGLYEVLSSEEMVEADVAGAREERREQKGYVPPASANSFFAHARVESLDKLLESDEVDPITRAHFRNSGTVPQRRPPAATTQEQRVAAAALLETLRDAAVIDQDTKSLAMLGTGADTSTNASELMLTHAMRSLRERDEAKYAERLNEIAYLSNALLAGCEYRSRELRPLEAAQAALAVCNLGAERLLGASESSTPADGQKRLPDLLATLSLVKLFRIGWHILYQQVIVPSTEVLLRKLDALAKDNAKSSAGRAASALRNELKAGKPWRANGQLSGFSDAKGSPDMVVLRSLIQQLPLVWYESSPPQQQTGLIASHAQVRTIQEALRRMTATAAKAKGSAASRKRARP